MSDEKKNEIIKSTLEVSYLPNLDFKKNKKYTKVSLSDIALLGGSFLLSPLFLELLIKLLIINLAMKLQDKKDYTEYSLMGIKDNWLKLKMEADF